MPFLLAPMLKASYGQLASFGNRLSIRKTKHQSTFDDGLVFFRLAIFRTGQLKSRKGRYQHFEEELDM